MPLGLVGFSSRPIGFSWLGTSLFYSQAAKVQNVYTLLFQSTGCYNYTFDCCYWLLVNNIKLIKCVTVSSAYPGTVPYLACLHYQSKSGSLEGRLFSSQSGHFENFSDWSDWLDKSRPSKKATFI